MSGRVEAGDDSSWDEATPKVCDDKRGEGNYVNFRIVLESLQPNPEYHGDKATDMEGVDGITSFTKELSPSGEELRVFAGPTNVKGANGP